MTEPVRLIVPADEGQNRLWGIPLLGIVLRWILVIPHAILLFFLGFGVAMFVLVSWIPVLVNGRQASWGYSLMEAYFIVSSRVAMYVALITGRYPPFGWTGDHPIRVELDRGQPQNRLWGTPLIGLYARWIVLIPHWIVLWVLSLAVFFVFLVSWIPVLVNGRQNETIVSLIGGYYRYGLRVGCYALLLTGRYPPFRLGD